MHAQYRYKGKFISAAKAARLSKLPGTKDKVSTTIREDKRSSKAVATVSRFLKDVALKTAYAIEKDRSAKAEQRQRRIERERQRTQDYERTKVEPSYKRETPRYQEPEIDLGGAYRTPQYEEEPFTGLEPLPDEDDLIDDYFEIAVEVADIDGDVYQED